MENDKGTKTPDFNSLDDRLIGDGLNQAAFSMKTNLDPKDPLENNPYFDQTKEYSKEELEKFKKFFGGK